LLVESTCEDKQGIVGQQHPSQDSITNTNDSRDAKVFVGRIIDALVAGNLLREEAIREICFYIMGATVPELASFLREDLVSTMDGYAFERFIGLIFFLMGYAIEITPKSRDQGVDIIASRGDRRIAIQCKRFAKGALVSNSAIQEVFAGMSYYKCTDGLLVTTSSLTPHAQELADSLDIKCWDEQYMKVLCSDALGTLPESVDLIEDFIKVTEFPGAAIIQTVAEQRRKVLAIIRKHGSISHSKLLRLCWRIANAQEMRDIIDDLEKLGRIRKREEGIYGGAIYDYIGERSR
jgi:hypothetical protein